jgi:hypothetical protein
MRRRAVKAFPEHRTISLRTFAPGFSASKRSVAAVTRTLGGKKNLAPATDGGRISTDDKMASPRGRPALVALQNFSRKNPAAKNFSRQNQMNFFLT